MRRREYVLNTAVVLLVMLTILIVANVIANVAVDHFKAQCEVIGQYQQNGQLVKWRECKL